MLPVIDLLLESGSNPDEMRPGTYEAYKDTQVIPYDTGYTPLTLAARHGWYEVAGMLLKNGADPSLPRADRTLALDIAIESAHPKTAALIREHMLANKSLERSR